MCPFCGSRFLSPSDDVLVAQNTDDEPGIVSDGGYLFGQACRDCGNEFFTWRAITVAQVEAGTITPQVGPRA